MQDEQIEALIYALENATRREILRELTSDSSYAMELSRLVGVSQQAINKHLFLLERANLIRLVEDVENSRKKLYMPTGFSSLIIDYSKNFFSVVKKEIFPDDTEDLTEIPEGELFEQLKHVNSEIEEITERRVSLLSRKDSILARIHSRINRLRLDPISRKIIGAYMDCLDAEKVSSLLEIPRPIIDHILTINEINP